MIELRRRWNDYSTQDSFDLADKRSGFPTSYPLRKRTPTKIWVCIGFRNLNKATPKDEYPMPIDDMLINNASGHQIITFLDGNAGYNQIFMAEEDMSKTPFVVLILSIYLNELS
jgi:hypothetical protein